MSQSDVAALCVLLSNGQADMTLFPGLYADVVKVLGEQDWHTIATPVTFIGNQNTVNLPPALLNLLTLIYDDTVLSDLELREMESLNPGWRNVKGSPIAFTREEQQVKAVQLYPTPTFTSPPIIPVHGLPTGQDYAPGNGIAVYSQSVTNVLPYLTLPVALLVLAREYVRESPHQDFAFAMMCKALGEMILGMLK